MPQNFFMSYFLLIIQTFLVVFAVIKFLSFFHNHLGKIEKIALGILYGYALPILITTVLGALNILSYEAVLGTLLLLNLSLIWVKTPKNTGDDQKEKASERPNYRTILAVLLVYTPLICFTVIKLINASLLQVVETDSLTYHLPFAAQWFQTQSIWAPYYTAFAGPIGYYPANYELISLFLFFPFKSDALINLANFPLMLGFGLSLYLIGFAAGLRGAKSYLAPAILLFTPMFIRQMGTPQNDLFFAFCLSIFIYFALRLYATKQIQAGDLLPIGISAGMFIGTKSSGIVYGSLLMLIVLVGMWIKIRRENSSTKWKHTGVIVGTTMLFGGFWYIRNLVYTGNPLFPLDVNILGWHILKGSTYFIDIYKNSSLASHLDITNLKMFIKSISISTGISWILINLAFFLSLFDLRKNKNRWIAIIVALTMPIMFALYIITPFTSANIYPNIRYLIPLFLIGYTGLVYTLKKGYWLLSIVSLSGFVLIAKQHLLLEYINDYVYYHIREVLNNPALVLLCMATLVSLAGAMWYKKRSLTITSLVLSVVIFGVFLDKSLALREQKGFESFYMFSNYIYEKNMIDAFQFIEKTAPQSAKIAYTEGNFHYPLFGKNWTREVDYVNINDCKNCTYYEYKDAKKSIRTNPDIDAWLNNLKKKQKEYLVILSKNITYGEPYELQWSEKRPDLFEKIFTQGEVTIFRILPVTTL